MNNVITLTETKTMLFIIVKGNASDAMMQAKLHHIDMLVDGESDNHNETYCYAPLSDKGKVIAWYAKDASIAILPSRGECLWYAERKVKCST
jgi:hypothetical protein